MAAKESRKRIRVSEQSSSGAPEPALDPFPNFLGGHDLGILREQIDTLAEKKNLPLGSEEQDAWVDAIMEEQAAMSARSRREAIEDFYCVCVAGEVGWWLQTLLSSAHVDDHDGHLTSVHGLR